MCQQINKYVSIFIYHCLGCQNLNDQRDDLIIMKLEVAYRFKHVHEARNCVTAFERNKKWMTDHKQEIIDQVHEISKK